VDVRRAKIRVIHRTDAYEPDGVAGLRVVAPNCNPTAWTASDLLTLAARRRCHDNFGLTRNVHDTISLIECIERVRGPGLALAPAAVARVHN